MAERCCPRTMENLWTKQDYLDSQRRRRKTRKYWQPELKIKFKTLEKPVYVKYTKKKLRSSHGKQDQRATGPCSPDNEVR